MGETALIAFTTFFATIGPIDVAAIFAALTAQHPAAERSRLARRAVLIAAAILYSFAFFGKPILTYLGVSLAALRIAGGILLLLIGIDMVFARDSGGITATDSEKKEAQHRDDISVFPVATPLLAGPGAISAVILLFSTSSGQQQLIAVTLALAAVLLLAYYSLLIAAKIQSLLGETGMHVIARILGIIIAALAVQFMLDGLHESGLLR